MGTIAKLVEVITYDVKCNPREIPIFPAYLHSNRRDLLELHRHYDTARSETHTLTSSVQCTTMDAYFLDNQRKNAGTPMTQSIQVIHTAVVCHQSAIL